MRSLHAVTSQTTPRLGIAQFLRDMAAEIGQIEHQYTAIDQELKSLVAMHNAMKCYTANALRWFIGLDAKNKDLLIERYHQVWFFFGMGTGDCQGLPVAEAKCRNKAIYISGAPLCFAHWRQAHGLDAVAQGIQTLVTTPFDPAPAPTPPPPPPPQQQQQQQLRAPVYMPSLHSGEAEY